MSTSTLGHAVHDGVTLSGRTIAHWRRRPAPLLVELLFPVLLLLMFGYLFGGAFTVPDGAYRDFLVPGMLALSMLFGVETTMTAVATDVGRGVTDRLRSMPIAASAVLTGRCLADMLRSVLELVVLMVAGSAMGWRPQTGPLALLAAIGLLLALRVGVLWLGIYLGLVAGRPDVVAAVQILVWPVGFASSVFVSPQTMPDWLGAVAAWNPLSVTATAVRDLLGNPGWAATSWPEQHAGVLALALPALLVAVFAPLAVRRYRRLGA